MCVCGLVRRQTVAFRAGARLHHSPPRVTQGLGLRLVTRSLFQLRASEFRTLLAPAGCPPASERAPEPVPAAGSGSDRLCPARAGAGGRVRDPGACGPAAGRARFRPWVSGHRSHPCLRTRLESSAGSIGSCVRAGKVSRSCAREWQPYNFAGLRGRGTRRGSDPPVRVPSARALEPGARRVACSCWGSRENERSSPQRSCQTSAPEPSQRPRHLVPKENTRRGKAYPGALAGVDFTVVESCPLSTFLSRD